MPKLSIVTYNVFNTPIKNMFNSDIVCTQEEPLHKSRDLKYKRLIHGNLNNRLGLYFKTNIDFINKISIIISKHVRHGLIINCKGITIANLHLEGGRYCDTELFSNFDKLLVFKLKLINSVINEKPDIILGDFNSVYAVDNNRKISFLENQYSYFYNLSKMDGLSKLSYLSNLNNLNNLNNIEKKLGSEKIKKWNMDPYEILIQNGYIYAKPENELMEITSKKGNSIVDTIWYNSKLKLEHCEIIIDEHNRSDHNPVKAVFTIN